MLTPPYEPRAAALADFLRGEARALSLSAEVTGTMQIARVGMALLDAALLAERLSPSDPLLVCLSEEGLFESLPDNRACFAASAEIHRAIYRPIAGRIQNGPAILDTIASAARRP